MNTDQTALIWVIEEHSGGSVGQNSPGHCVKSLSKIFYPLLSTGSTQEDIPSGLKNCC